MSPDNLETTGGMNRLQFLSGEAAHTAARVGYAMVLGVAGTLLLAFFLSLFMQVYHIVKFIPWLIGFNAAVTGYTLVNKKGWSGHQSVRLLSIMAGLGTVVLTWVALGQLSFYTTGEGLFSRTDLMLYLVIGGICSRLGSMLGIKYVTVIGRSRTINERSV